MVPSSRINFLSLINFIWILSSCTSCSGHISKSTQARKWITGVAVSEGRGSGKTETSVFSFILFSSVTHSWPSLCKPMDCMPGLPVHHHLLELVQTLVRWVSDAIQPPHPLLSPSPPAFNLFQHQGLFQWVGQGGQSIGVSASVLPMNFQDFLQDWLVWSCSPRNSQESSLTPQFKRVN